MQRLYALIMATGRWLEQKLSQLSTTFRNTHLFEHKQWGPDTSLLAKKTPAEIRDIAWRYQQKISGKAGNTWERITFFSGCFLAVGYCLIWLDRWANLPLSTGSRWTLIIGSWVMLGLLSLPVFTTFVPKLAAVIVTNFFNGRMHVLTPGFNIRYPWEFFHREIDELSQRAGEVIRSSTFLSKDGVHVTFGSWVVQWGPFLPLQPRSIRDVGGCGDSSEASVSETVAEIVESTLFQEVLKRNVEGAQSLRDPVVVDEIETALIQALESGGTAKGDKLRSSIEERNGVVIEIAALGPVSFSKDYEEALVARRTVAMMREDAKQLATDLEIEGSQALDSVMIANKETVQRSITKFEIDKNIRETVSTLAEGIKEGIIRVAKSAADSQPQGGSQ